VTRVDPTGTVARTLLVLGAIAEADGPISVSTMARDLRLPTSTVHRLLELLVDGGMLEKGLSSRRYAPGAEFFRIAHLVAGRTSFPSMVQPLLAGLARATGEMALLGMYLPAQKAMMFAAKADSPQPLRYRIDLFRPLPLGWGASGLAILAFLDDPAVQEFVAREPAPVTGERRDPDALAFLIAQTRRDGFVVTCGEKLAGAVGIAAPLHSAAGKLVGQLL
jgi:DNA-binding IclR family transcriptional regulator